MLVISQLISAWPLLVLGPPGLVTGVSFIAAPHWNGLTLMNGLAASLISLVVLAAQAVHAGVRRRS